MPTSIPAWSAVRLGRTVLVVAAAAVCAAAGAQPSGAARFKPYDGAPKQPDVNRLAIARAEQPVQMVVVLSEPSVAAARGAAFGHRISAADRDAVVRRVGAQHATLRPQLQSRGATVLAQFHAALNGIKVEVKPSQVAALKALPGVVAVLPVMRHRPDNTSSVPYIGTPQAWQGVPGREGFRGEGIKVGIIDTGIDYTHADFGGPGTTQAYQTAKAAGTAAADPALFGPSAPKVKGGIDLVGDAYDADVAGSKPAPDPNPLDCNGHGSHVAGTAAGFGVTAAGATYKGPYNTATYTNSAFLIGPGVAPKADLYAIRVFGCGGTTNVVVDAIDWAVDHDMDVINMSLGSSFGPADSADALAAAAAVQAGIVVVASAGNAGPAPYIHGSPASADGVLSAAAVDGRSSFPGASITLANGQVIKAQDSNGAPLPTAVLPVVVLRNSDGTVSLGCSQAEYAGVAGKLVVTLRGVCPRVDRATFGQAAGAAAVALINNGPGYGVYEGAIPGVTIPFLGIQPSDAPALTASATAKLAPLVLTNPALGTIASFSSGGPRFGDSVLKPSVAAPGVSVYSALVGGGSAGQYLSGTSMAAPHVAGVAALVTQAHPGWTASELSSVVATTADPSKLPDFKIRLDGAGLVQPFAATLSQVAVSVDGVPVGSGISFGFAEFTRDYSAVRTVRVQNKGTTRLSFNVAVAAAAGARPHTLTSNRSTISIAPGATTEFGVRLAVPVATAGASHNDAGDAQFNEVAGMVTLTPTSIVGNTGVALQLPYYLVDRARSEMTARLSGSTSAQLNVNLSNERSQVPAVADFYALGLHQNGRQGAGVFDLRAVGTQSFPVDGTRNLLVFAVNTAERFSNAAAAEVDIYVDVDNDGKPDYVVLSADVGAVTAGDPNGQAGVFVVNLKTNALTGPRFLTDAPTDGSIMLLPVLTSDIGLSKAQPRFVYSAYSFGNNGGTSEFAAAATFNAFSPAIATGSYVPLAPGATATVAVPINAAEFPLTPPLGVMVVNQENRSGPPQATLLPRGGR